MWERQGDGGRRRQTAILTHNFIFSWPYHAVLSSEPYIFASSVSWPAITGRSLPHRASGGQSPRLTVSRPKTPDWGLILARLPVSAVHRVYIISQRPRIPVVTHVTCFRLRTQVRLAITLFTQLKHPVLSMVNMQHKAYNIKHSSLKSFRLDCLHFPFRQKGKHKKGNSTMQFEG